MSAFTLLQLNVGQAPAARVVRAMQEHHVDAFTLDEMSDRPDIYSGLADAGYLTFASGRPGGRATPVGWLPDTMDSLARWSVPLHDGANMGPGTGPDQTKAKRLNGVHLRDRDTGRHVLVGSAHLFTSQRWHLGLVGNRRARDSRTMVADSVAHLGQYGATAFLGVDGNAGRRSRTWAPARREGWADARVAAGGHLVTHPPKWDPDTILTNLPRRRGTITKVYTVEVGSDHLGVVMVCDLTIRPGS